MCTGVGACVNCVYDVYASVRELCVYDVVMRLCCGLLCFEADVLVV